jgi:hypothetical protein
MQYPRSVVVAVALVPVKTSFMGQSLIF